MPAARPPRSPLSAMVYRLPTGPKAPADGQLLAAIDPALTPQLLKPPPADPNGFVYPPFSPWSWTRRHAVEGREETERASTPTVRCSPRNPRSNNQRAKPFSGSRPPSGISAPSMSGRMPPGSAPPRDHGLALSHYAPDYVFLAVFSQRDNAAVPKGAVPLGEPHLCARPLSSMTVARFTRRLLHVSMQQCIVGGDAPGSSFF